MCLLTTFGSRLSTCYSTRKRRVYCLRCSYSRASTGNFSPQGDHDPSTGGGGGVGDAAPYIYIYCVYYIPYSPTSFFKRVSKGFLPLFAPKIPMNSQVPTTVATWLMGEDWFSGWGSTGDFLGTFTRLPKTNSKEKPLKIGREPKRKGSSSNHSFSGANC